WSCMIAKMNNAGSSSPNSTRPRSLCRRIRPSDEVTESVIRPSVVTSHHLHRPWKASIECEEVGDEQQRRGVQAVWVSVSADRPVAGLGVSAAAGAWAWQLVFRLPGGDRGRAAGTGTSWRVPDPPRGGRGPRRAAGPV